MALSDRSSGRATEPKTLHVDPGRRAFRRLVYRLVRKRIAQGCQPAPRVDGALACLLDC